MKVMEICIETEDAQNPKALKQKSWACLVLLLFSGFSKGNECKGLLWGCPHVGQRRDLVQLDMAWTSREHSWHRCLGEDAQV